MSNWIGVSAITDTPLEFGHFPKGDKNPQPGVAKLPWGSDHRPTNPERVPSIRHGEEDDTIQKTWRKSPQASTPDKTPVG